VPCTRVVHELPVPENAAVKIKNNSMNTLSQTAIKRHHASLQRVRSSENGDARVNMPEKKMKISSLFSR
jgi:hypothetical protein